MSKKDSAQKSPGTGKPNNNVADNHGQPNVKLKKVSRVPRKLLTRYQGNPILTARDWPYTVNSVFNAGATRLPSGETVLLCRVEERTGLSHLAVARSHDGVSDWVVDREPAFVPAPDRYPEESWGIEDARIVWVPELDRYAVTYTAYSSGGPGVSLAFTEDFREFERVGPVMPPDNKDAALIPHRIGDCWALVHRPSTAAGAHIWVSYAPDLRHWGSHKLMLHAGHGPWWDAVRIGLGPPLIETEEGWLMIYHGVRETAAGALYRIGLALFDLETLEKCLLRSDEWILGPEAPYELMGDVSGVVFPCGYTLNDDGDSLHLYYSGADSCVCLAQGSISEMMAWLKTHGSPGGEIRNAYAARALYTVRTAL